MASSKSNGVNKKRLSVPTVQLFTSVLLAVGWTALHVNLGIQSHHEIFRAEKKNALSIAMDNFNKDLLYRQWCAQHGGVYVQKGPNAPPNPYLSHIPMRDIVTADSNLHLTLFNPAYMVRQVQELGATQYGLKAHITSLKPLRPENAPDRWERRVLAQFEKDTAEVSSLEMIDSIRYLRYMKFLRTDQSCLKCHAHQGYKVGDIRGGISVSVPWAPFDKVVRNHNRSTTTRLCITWFLGMIGLLTVFFVLRKSIKTHDQMADDQRHMEIQLLTIQKLESLGVLAGGIAHDFNNLLGGIYGYIDISMELCAEKKVRKNLGKAMATIERTRGLTTQLLTFSKGGNLIRRVVSLPAFIEETVRFILSGSRVSSSFNIQEDLWTCHIDKGQIAQVIDNIVINAQQAMPDGGTMKVRAYNCTISHHKILADGRYVCITFSDQGDGIPETILTRIFDPFFTTKSSGHGLGLATCFSVVKQHGGTIDVASQPGKGSTFSIFLPAVNAEVNEMSKHTTKHTGSGTILIMDDESVIRETLTGMLESVGYSVLQTCDGSEALTTFEQDRRTSTSITAIILDMTIPGGMGGKETLYEIRKIDPKIPVFIATGYSDDLLVGDPSSSGFTGSIAKPFRRSELMEFLEKYLNQKSE